MQRRRAHVRAFINGSDIFQPNSFADFQFDFTVGIGGGAHGGAEHFWAGVFGVAVINWAKEVELDEVEYACLINRARI
jgi:hypothetical protein